MAQISISNLTFYYEGSFDNIFDSVSFSIDTNWKLGFIGRNGKGKTTFLNLLMGKYEYQGAINTSTTFDYFPYSFNADKCLSASEMISFWKPGCEEWRVICELGKLNEEAFDKSLFCSILRQLNLYIDVFSRMQIEKLILDYQPTMLFVEHDVRFREKIATRTIEVNI